MKRNSFLQRACTIVSVSRLFCLGDFLVRREGQHAVFDLYRLLLLTVTIGSTAYVRMRGGRRWVNCVSCIACRWVCTTVTELARKREAKLLFSPLALKAEERGSAIHPAAMFSFLSALKCNIGGWLSGVRCRSGLRVLSHRIKYSHNKHTYSLTNADERWI